VVSEPSKLPIPRLAWDGRERTTDAISNKIDTDFSNSSKFRNVGLNQPKEFRFVFEHAFDMTWRERARKGDSIATITSLPFGDTISIYVTFGSQRARERPGRFCIYFGDDIEIIDEVEFMGGVDQFVDRRPDWNIGGQPP
jgi:hypothetical protein